MPVGISSAARNLFLLGSSGADVVTNFFKAIDQSASPDDQFVAKGIQYSEYDEKFILGLQAEDSNSKKHGLVEKRAADGVTDWDFEIESTTTEDTILTDIHLDVNGNLLVSGSVGNVPFVSKYSSAGVLDWQSTTNTADVRYNSVTSDSNGKYYACGNTDETSGAAAAFIEKYDAFGTPGWGKGAFIVGSDVVLHAIDCNSRGHVVAGGYLQDENNDFKGYFVKLDTASGQVMWDRTLEITDRDWGTIPVTEINDVMIDGNDFIYIVGSQFNAVSGNSAGYICKYSPEGNMLWQKETPIGAANSGRWRYNCVEADTATGQIIILGSYFENTSDEYGVLVKYSSDGRKIFTRVLESTEASPPEFGTLAHPKGGMALDASASFYYILFTDQETDPANTIPDKYTYGKVSSSGNGLGAFSYDTGDTNTIEYYIQDLGDRIGRLSDGSVRNDTSDLATNIFNPTKIMFDDLATPIANKKRQMNSADNFQYSGSPAIRPVDFETREFTTDGYGVPPQKNYIGLSETLQPTSTSSTGTTNNTWSRQSTNLTVTANNISNPLGVGSGAERYNISATFGRRLEYGVPSGVFVAGQIYTYSWWMKAITTDAEWQFQAYSAGSSNNTIRIADRYGNILENISNTITYKPKDTEWHRVVWTFTANNTTGSPVGGYNNNNETGNLWYLWGAQLVDGPDPLPYYRNYNSTPENVNGNEHTPSIVNGAYEFDGSEILQIGPVPEIGDEFTVEIWFKSDTHSNWQNPIDCNYGSQDLLGNGVVNSGNIGPRLEINASGTFAWVFGSTLAANDPFFATPAGSGSTGVWYHSVITYGGGGATDGRSYLNGEFVSQSSQSTGGTAGWVGEFRNVILGRGFTLATRYFDGQVGEVRIYPKALTAAQVYQNYNATKGEYLNEAPDTAPKIGPGIVYDSNLLLNYDFGNRATFDSKTSFYALPFDAVDDDLSEELIVGPSANSHYGTAVKLTDSGKMVVAMEYNYSTPVSIYDFRDGSVISWNLPAGHSPPDEHISVGSGRVAISAVNNSSGVFAEYNQNVFVYDEDFTNEVIINNGLNMQLNGPHRIYDGKIYVASRGGEFMQTKFINVYDVYTGNQLDQISYISVNTSSEITSMAIGLDKIAFGIGSAGRVILMDLDGSNPVDVTPAGLNGSNSDFGRRDQAIAIGIGPEGVGKLYVGEGDYNSNAGRVYSFNLDGTASTIIEAPNSEKRFGQSVAVDNGTLVVGSSNNETWTGSEPGFGNVYVVDSSGSANLTPSVGGADGNEYGAAVDIRKNRIVVGARNYTPVINGFAQTWTGGVYAYKKGFPAPTKVKNLSSTNFPGSITSATFDNDGYFEFNGTNSEIITDDNINQANLPLTYECWVRTANGYTPSGYVSLMSTYDPNPEGFWILLSPTNGYVTAGNDGSTFHISSTAVNDGDWHHVVATLDIPNVRIYVDGTDVGGLSNAPNNIIPSTRFVRIGSMAISGVSSRFLDGDIGEARIYNRALSATEISQNFNATKSKYGV